MKTKGRPKSTNIVDKRTPKKIRNNNDKRASKLRDTEFLKLYTSGKKKSKYSKKKIGN